MKFAVGDRVMLKPDRARVLLLRARKRRSTGTVQEIFDNPFESPTYRVQRDGKVAWDRYHESDLMACDEYATGMLIAADWLEEHDEVSAAEKLRKEFA